MPPIMQTSHSSAASSSDGSEHSRSTAPTDYSRRMAEPFFTEDPRDSNSTYASTVSSDEDLPKEGRDEERAAVAKYEVVTDRPEVFASSAISSNQATFADLFPSGRRLLIHHDDSTLDGNMNLRVDTLLSRRDRRSPLQEVTLFHLRMHDLHSRTFSFRRYCRDSGREVCHSRRLTPAAHSQRPTLRRSWSSVLSGLRPGSSDKHSVTGFLNHHHHHNNNNNNNNNNHNTYHKHQSLPKSSSPLQEFFNDESSTTSTTTNKTEKLTNTILLEFCNYAHVELSRVGVKPSKRYEFEYWSTRYQWRRESRKEACAGDQKEISYHLVNLETSRTVAYIVPEILTPMEQMEEEGKGGWVPKCSMWISDSSVYERMSDIADVIVATGITVLVDDSIRRRWHNKRHVRLSLGSKRSSFFLLSMNMNMNMESLGPKRLIDEMFHRRGSA
ncbi:hypothetical protein UA08_02743 [Talaromyces atroroseus]|uniref:Uncharacterized protein n=1 Tax=Talaromyces atroroseus TaxID=1441469 RepID=A0A225AKK0_TALAT|nr:hypothetical protein UA08_02743 [Talaromyces atroroseus]OKL62062.1 hypothetical protein UA08_02743 [Talaromyces atroroseus]